MENEKPVKVEIPSDEYLTDIDFLEAADTKPKVSKDTAMIDLRKMLIAWKVLKKAIRKAKSGKRNQAKRDEYEESKEILVNAIQDGTLIVDGNSSSGLKLIHKLLDPPPGYAELIYKRIPKLVDLRKMDTFTDDEGMGQLQALAAAMSGKAIAELAVLSAADIDVIGALFYFFV